MAETCAVAYVSEKDFLAFLCRLTQQSSLQAAEEPHRHLPSPCPWGGGGQHLQRRDKYIFSVPLSLLLENKDLH